MDFTLEAAADTDPDAAALPFGLGLMTRFFGAVGGGTASSPLTTSTPTSTPTSISSGGGCRLNSSNSVGSFASAIASAADALLRFTGSSVGKIARLPNLIGAPDDDASSISGEIIPNSGSNSLRRTVSAAVAAAVAPNLLEKDGGITPRCAAANFALSARRSISFA